MREPAVLHFAADWLPPSEVFLYDLVRSLRRRGLVVAGEPLLHSDRFPLPAIPVRSLAPLERITPPAVRPPVVTAALSLLARRERVGIVHVHHGYRIDQVLGTVRRRGLPLVVSLHGHDVTGYLEGRPRAYREAAGLASAVIVPSRFLVPAAVAAGFPEEVVRVLPSGIETGFFRAGPIPAGPPEALFVGRFVEKKGLDVLAAAWPAVQATVPGARLRILGYGPLETLARSIGGAEVVLAPDRETVREALTRARLVVSPSRTAGDDAVESLLMVNLEAQAAGRPVVTTRHGGIPEYVLEGETALVVPEGDPGALATALIAVLGDEDLARRLGGAGPAWAARFDLGVTAGAVDALYGELLGETPGMARSGAELLPSRT